MTRWSIGACGIAIVLGACGNVESPARRDHRVGGSVGGLWDGVDGVALRLESDSVNTLLTVSANGHFEFEATLGTGASYTVTIAANPARHTCVIDGGGNGAVADGDVTNVSVACRGPAVALALSGQWGWTFDPSRDTQTFAGSVVAQDVALTITGAELTGAVVAGAAASLGTATAPLALPLGSITVPVAVTAAGGLTKTYQLVFQRGGSLPDQVAYGKPSNTAANDIFGTAVALSGDTLVVGANCESSGATGINSNQTDNTASCAGAVYVFVRTSTTWTQQAYLKASNTGAEDSFGTAVALSGNTLAVGAPGEDSGATRVDGSQTDNAASSAGAVYVFVRSGAVWTQQAYLKATNAGANDELGAALALSGDTLAVGATGEDSAATTINGGEADNGASSAGAVYVFSRTSTTWTQQAYIKASNAQANDVFGLAVALAGDTLAVGAAFEASASVEINGNQADNGAPGAGAVYVFVRSGATWTQQAYVKAANAGPGDFFGSAVALSGDTLAVGAYHEASASRGINSQGDDNASNAGAAYVFVRSGATWTQQAYVKASNTGAGDLFGAAVAVSGDTLAIGAYGEDSAAAGVDGDQADNTRKQAGAVYLFARDGTTWTQRAYLKASNPGDDDVFGWAVAVSGGTLAVGAYGEASGAVGINPANGQTDNGAAAAGAVYLFR